MSKRRHQTQEPMNLFFQYNRNKPEPTTQQAPRFGNNQQIIENLSQSLKNETVQRMIEKLLKDGSKIPLEILGLNQLYSFPSYNAVQSQCVLPLMFSGNNMLVCAPTATGKTVIMEMALLRELATRGIANYKILYLAPIRALCQQKVEEWAAKFSGLSITVSELTGDSDFSQKNSNIKGPHLIVATPEKWDSFIRRQKSIVEALSNYVLLLLDEIHCVGDTERGDILECVVSRLKSFTQLYKCKQRLRLVAVSATLPNIEDIAIWLNVEKQHGLLQFKDSDRSVPLEKHVFGYNCDNQFSFENYLNSRLLTVIERFSEDKPALVFCQTQKGTQQACAALIQQGKPNQFIRDDDHASRLSISFSNILVSISQSIFDKTLAGFIKQGIGFHNANLSSQDRIIVEKLFLANDLSVICTTTTLALGVNLPAHLVVIKSTLCYKGQGSGYQEYGLYELCQMMGRAGRPQFDDKGIVVIMTDIKMYQHYKKIFEENGDHADCPPLESYLGDNLATILNAEIGIGYISSLDQIMKFVSNTYYYVRQMVIQRAIYDDVDEFQTQVDKIILDKCNFCIVQLHKLNLIRYDERAKTMEATDLGRELAKQNLQVQTMEKLYQKNLTQQSYLVYDLLGLLVQAVEFDVFKQKQNEKSDLSKLNKLIKWKLKGTINTPAKKTFVDFVNQSKVFIQAYIGNLPMEWELRRQSSDLVNLATRILRCFRKFFQINNVAAGYISSMKLLSYLDNKSWPDDPKSLLCQFQGIGEKTSTELVKLGYQSIGSIRDSTPSTLCDQIKKPLAFIEQLIATAKSHPTIQSIRVQSNSTTAFEMVVNVSLVSEQTDAYIIITEAEKLIMTKKLTTCELKYQYKNELHDVYFQLKIHLCNIKMVGLNEVYCVKIKSFQGRSEAVEVKLMKSDDVLTPSANIDFELEFILRQQAKLKFPEQSVKKILQPPTESIKQIDLYSPQMKTPSLFDIDLDFSFFKAPQKENGDSQEEEMNEEFPHLTLNEELATINPGFSIGVPASPSRSAKVLPFKPSGNFADNLARTAKSIQQQQGKENNLKRRQIKILESNEKVEQFLNSSVELCTYKPNIQFLNVQHPQNAAVDNFQSRQQPYKPLLNIPQGQSLYAQLQRNQVHFPPQVDEYQQHPQNHSQLFRNQKSYAGIANQEFRYQQSYPQQPYQMYQGLQNYVQPPQEYNLQGYQTSYYYPTQQNYQQQQSNEMHIYQGQRQGYGQEFSRGCQANIKPQREVQFSANEYLMKTLPSKQMKRYYDEEQTEKSLYKF